MSRVVARLVIWTSTAGLLCAAMARSDSSANRLDTDAVVAAPESLPDSPGVAIFPDDFETGDPYNWSSFSPAATLSLTNYLAWCTFVIEGEPASTAPTLTRAFLPGTVVHLTGEPVSPFVWEFWTGTDGDIGPSHDTNHVTVVTMSADKSVLECCDVLPGGTCP